MPPEVQFRSQFQGDGTLVLGARADGRPIMLPVSIRAATLLELEDKRRELLRMFDRRRGPGTFTWALRDGSARSIGLLYESGFSTALRGHSGAWPLRFEYQIVCWADDPYFYGGEQMLSFTPPVGDDGPFYPGPPFQIGGGPAPGPGRATRLCRPAPSRCRRCHTLEDLGLSEIRARGLWSSPPARRGHLRMLLVFADPPDLRLGGRLDGHRVDEWPVAVAGHGRRRAARAQPGHSRRPPAVLRRRGPAPGRRAGPPPGGPPVQPPRRSRPHR
jgi:hypothetical protein